MSKHTPLPWQADGEVVYTTVGEDETVADCWEASDAEFIVRACNAHDDLLEACKAARSIIDEFHGGTIQGDIVLTRLNDAISHAEGSHNA